MERPRYNVHADCFSKFRNLAANRSGPDQAERLALELRGETAGPFPFPHLLVDGHDAFRDRDNKRKRVLSHCDRRNARRIRHTDSVSFRSFKVDVVGSRSPDGNHPEISRATQDFSAETRCSSNIDHNRGIANSGEQIFRRRRPA